MKKPYWRSADIIREFSINPSTFNNWVKEGFIKPTYQGRGTGRPHGWTLDNLYEIELFRYLINTGIAREEAGKIIKTHPFNTAEWIKTVVLPEHPHPERVQTEAPMLRVSIKDGKPYTGVVIGKDATIWPEKVDLHDFDEIRFISLKKIERRIAKLFK